MARGRHTASGKAHTKGETHYRPHQNLNQLLKQFKNGLQVNCCLPLEWPWLRRPVKASSGFDLKEANRSDLVRVVCFPGPA